MAVRLAKHKNDGSHQLCTLTCFMYHVTSEEAQPTTKKMVNLWVEGVGWVVGSRLLGWVTCNTRQLNHIPLEEISPRLLLATFSTEHLVWRLCHAPSTPPKRTCQGNVSRHQTELAGGRRIGSRCPILAGPPSRVLRACGVCYRADPDTHPLHSGRAPVHMWTAQRLFTGQCLVQLNALNLAQLAGKRTHSSSGVDSAHVLGGAEPKLLLLAGV